MRTSPIFRAVLITLAFGGGSLACAQHYTPDYDACLGRAGSSTVQQGMCAQAELTRQDEHLNRSYQALMALYQQPRYAARRTQLRDSERTWIERRDTECKLDHDTVDNVCLIQRTALRASMLDGRLEQQSGK